MTTIPDTLKEFFAYRAGRLRSKNSIETYSNQLHLLHRHVHKPVSRYTADDLAAWVQAGDNISPATMALRLNVARSYFQWATWSGLVKADPTFGLKDQLRIPTKTVRQHNWLTRAQVRALLDACPGDILGRRDYVLCSLGFFTGRRVSEICALRWEQVSLGHRQLRLVAKGEKPVTVGLAGQLTEVLEKWRLVAEEATSADVTPLPVLPAARRQWEGCGLYGDGELTVLWDKALGDGGARSVVHQAGARIGVPNLAPHDMRRSLAGILDADGVPITEIRDVLGHSSVAITEKYLQANPARSVNRLKGFEL